MNRLNWFLSGMQADDDDDDQGLLDVGIPFLGFIKRNQVPVIKVKQVKEEKCELNMNQIRRSQKSEFGIINA